jgi:hypothetical protein
MGTSLDIEGASATYLDEIPIEPLVGDFLASMDTFCQNSGFPELILNEEQRAGAYRLVVGPFVRYDLAVIHLNGDPKAMIKKLKKFKECCNEIYGSVEAEEYFRLITKELITKEISEVKEAIESGSYSHSAVRKAVEKSINFVVGEVHNYKRSLA